MEITRLEVSTQKHIDRIQDTAKINYVQYGKGSKKGKLKSSGSKNSGSSGNSGSTGGPPKSSGKGKESSIPNRHLLGDVAKADIRKDNLARQWKQCAGTVQDIMKKCA